MVCCIPVKSPSGAALSTRSTGRGQGGAVEEGCWLAVVVEDVLWCVEGRLGGRRSDVEEEVVKLLGTKK